MLSLQISGLDRAVKQARDVPRQVRFASSRALNDVAFAARQDVQNFMVDNFTGRGGEIPTPWVLQSITVGPAKPDNLVATVYPRYLGGKSVDPSNVLNPEVHGGVRKAKKAEVALRRIGILGPDQYVVPGSAAPLDVYGNIPGPFWVHLLSYFQAFGEQGYRANMTARTKARWAAKGRNANGFMKTFGVEYFVSFGKRRSLSQGGAQNLPAGIWSRTGTGGSDVKPIVMFVRMPHYRVRFPIEQIVGKTVAEQLPFRFHTRLAEAMATAR